MAENNQFGTTYEFEVDGFPVDKEDEETLICSKCGEEISEDDEYETTEDGDILCQDCFEDLYSTCGLCGKVTLDDDLAWWGDLRICPDCMEEKCPSFDEEDNLEETEEAYEEMKEKYLGLRVEKYRDKTITIDYIKDQYTDFETNYSISVTFDNEGRISDISRLSASKCISESERYSDWRDCPVDDYDYSWTVDKMFKMYFRFID